MMQVNQSYNNNQIDIVLSHGQADVLKKLFNLKYIFEIKKKPIFEIFECSLLRSK